MAHFQRVKDSALTLRVAASKAEDAGLVAQGLHGCQCHGLKVRVRNGDFEFYMPHCDNWKPIAEAVEKSLLDAGFRVEVLGLVRRNMGATW